MLLEDDGSIIVGGLGAGGNWGQDGKLQFGLQKLVPNGTETFDIQKMELADGGFKLTYTKPLSDATLADLAEKYTARQWTYAPTSAYGGPRSRTRRWTSPTRRSPPTARSSRSSSTPQAEPRRLRALTAAVRRAGRHEAAEHRGLVHAQQAARLRRAHQRRALRARGRHPHRRRAVRHRARRLQRHRVRVRLRHGRGVDEDRRQRAEGRRLPDGAALRQRPEPVQRPEEDQPDRQRHEPPDHAAATGRGRATGSTSTP